jgi:hypothetical protein
MGNSRGSESRQSKAVCAPLPVQLTGWGCDERQDWYVRIRVKSPNGSAREALFAFSDISKSHEPVYEFLGRAGVPVSREGRHLISKMLGQPPTKANFRVATAFGMCGAHFVTPNGVYGPKPGSIAANLPNLDRDASWKPRGTLEQFLKGLEWAGKGNTLLQFVVCLAFVGPVLPLLKAGSLGFSLIGNPSVGKTTLAKLLRSVWKGADDGEETLLKSPEAFEQMVWRSRHCSVALDETNLLDRNESKRAEVLANLVFRLASGVTKERFGDAAPPRRSELAYLMTSNDSLETMLAATKQQYDDRFAVRLIEIPVKERYGVFACLPEGYSGVKLVTKIAAMADKQYGAAADAFLKKLMADRHSDREALRAWLRDRVDWMRKKLGVDENSGVEARIADSFCLVYAAGRLAREYGVVPSSWQVSAVILHCYELNRRFRKVQKAKADHVECLRSFIGKNRHKFIDVREGLSVSDKEYRTALGFVTASKGEPYEYAFDPARFERRFGRSGQLNAVLEALDRAGFLKHDTDKRTVKRSIPAGKARKRVYCISGKVLADAR